MDTLAKKQLFNEIQRIASSRWYETRSQIQSFLNTAYILLEDDGEQLNEVVEAGGSAVGWVIEAASNTLIRREMDRFSVGGGAISLNSDLEDDFYPAEQVEEMSKLEERRKELSDDELEKIEFFAMFGTATIAEKWGCSQRNVQLKQKSFVESVRARLAGARGVQGDLFGQGV